MGKRFRRVNWEDSPSTKTPRNALFLNKGDKGLDDVDNALVELEIGHAALDVIVNGSSESDTSFTFEYGLVSIWDGTVGENSGSDTWAVRTNIFNFKYNDKIKFSDKNEWLYCIFYYDSNGNFLHAPVLDWTFITGEAVIALDPTYEYAKFMVCESGYHLNDYPDIEELQYEIGIKGVVKTGLTHRVHYLEERVFSDEDTHLDKTLVVFGDSITDRLYTEEGKGQWVNQMLEKVGFNEFKEYAVTFATWVNFNNTVLDLTYNPIDGGPNTIWNQYNRLKADISNEVISEPDAIVIYAGMNDVVNHYSTLGTVNDAFNGSNIVTQNVNTIKTTCKAIRYLCEMIQEERPLCQVILVLPYQVGNPYISGYLSELRTMMISSCEKLGVDYIDTMTKSGIYQYRENKSALFINGIHPTPLGGKRLGTFLTNQIVQRIRL